MSKHFFFQHYGIITILGALGIVALVVMTMVTGWDHGWQLVTTSAAGTIGFVYFIQKQRLDDVRLFHDLFTKFNERYDKLNGVLNAIVEQGDEAELTPDQCHVLNDYFNLCGEEYFFFKHDCIYPEVWAAWNRGMRLFYDRSDQIRRLWEQELRENCYYGFGLEHLRSSDSDNQRGKHPGDDAVERLAAAEA